MSSRLKRHWNISLFFKWYNIRGLAIKEGFKEEFIIENFWKEDSIKFNFGCTTCGKPPCLCSAIIYTKELE